MTRRSPRRYLDWTGRVLLVAAVAAAVGWATSRPEAAVTRNRLSSNRLAQNRLSSNRLAQNRLAQNALSSTRLETTLATTELLASEEGREVYSYIISCALPEGVTMEATVGGADDTAPPATLYTCAGGHCVFAGSLGLAPYWVDRPLPPKGQRWVTACLLARVNLHDTTEAISLRGVAPELTVGVDEAELYNVEEGAFFGNLFADGDAIDWNACRGRGQASGEFGGLNLRDCAEEDLVGTPGFTYCGFKYAGDCADFTPAFPSPYACRSFDSEEGTYSDCHATEGDGHWPGSRPYREVITVYVTGE
jgi:hypothetical protein